MQDLSQITIKFGGNGNIYVETLTDFLELYKKILYEINFELGYHTKDLVIEVSPPELGSFKISLKSKYRKIILKKIGELTTQVLAGLILVTITNQTQVVTKEEVEQLLEKQKISDKNVSHFVYNIFQKGSSQKQIQRTLIVVHNDENISNLIIEHQDSEIINISNKELPKLIDQLSNFDIDKPKANIFTEEVGLIIKTIHFEGNAKWVFVLKGHQIRAQIKDFEFLEKLKSESFRKGDSLRVILTRRSNYDEDLQTFIVDQNSYTIEKVLNHITKIDNQGKLNL